MKSYWREGFKLPGLEQVAFVVRHEVEVIDCLWDHKVLEVQVFQQSILYESNDTYERVLSGNEISSGSSQPYQVLKKIFTINIFFRT